jgi:AraC-like DNA-binding protein
MRDQRMLKGSPKPLIPETRGRNFYPDFTMPLAIRDISTDESWAVAPKGFGLVFLQTGEARLPGADEAIHGPVMVLLNKERNRVFVSGAHGWVIAFLPTIINTQFAEVPGLSPDQVEDPLFQCDMRLLALFSRVKASPFFPETRHAEFLSMLFRQVSELTLKQEDPYWPCRSRSYFLEILFFLANETDDDNSRVDQLTLRILEYLKSHYAEKITIGSLCREFATNRTSLQNLFKKDLNTSVIDFLLSYRIDVSCLLMRNTELPLKEIALRVGFSDYSQYFRSFRKNRSKTPHDYREKEAKVRIY